MELLDILDDHGNITGSASREECHSGSFLLHGVVHVLVFNSDGAVILQKRSLSKDIEPGKWDTSVGGHINSGETVKDALYREAGEELGITGAEFEYLYSYTITTDIERKFVTAFTCLWPGEILFQEEEIDEARPFSPSEVKSLLGTGIFTPNFEMEWDYYRKWRRKN